MGRQARGRVNTPRVTPRFIVAAGALGWVPTTCLFPVNSQSQAQLHTDTALVSPLRPRPPLPLPLLPRCLRLARLATLMQHAVLAARTLIAHSCPEADRAALLGCIGASYGLGFALGPAVGGLLSSISLTATAWAAAAGSLLAMVVVVLGLPQGEDGLVGGWVRGFGCLVGVCGMPCCVCVGGGART